MNPTGPRDLPLPDPSTCPVCGLPDYVVTIKRLAPEVMRSTYGCPMEHVWFTQWFAPKAVA